MLHNNINKITQILNILVFNKYLNTNMMLFTAKYTPKNIDDIINIDRIRYFIGLI
jgi:hypothetical protein